MEFNIDKNELQKALTTVSKGMSARTTLPILAGILVSAEGDMVKFQTTDLETSISHKTHADVVEEGTSVLPGKLLQDIAKSFQDAAVHVKTSENQAIVSCMNSSFTLSTLPAADFPAFPQVDPQQQIDVPANDLARAVQRVAFAASRDEARAVLTGIFFEVGEKSIRLVATDGYRLAVVDMPASLAQVDPFSAIIPSRAFDDVTRLSSSEQAISIGLSENQVMFTFGDTVFVSRRTEGDYPDYRGLLPKNHNLRVDMQTEDLKTAVKRVSLIAQAHSPVRFHFDILGQQAMVCANAQDVGNAEESIPMQIDGEDNLEIAFNHQYVLDALNVMGEQTRIEMQSSLKPGIFKPGEDESYLYLVMPVR